MELMSPEEEKKQVQVPEHILKYEPSENDSFITITSGEYQRLIFSKPLQLKLREVTELEKFRRYVKELGETFPEGYDDDQRLVLRYLQGCSWRHEEALKEIKVHVLWKQNSFPIDMESIAVYLNQGIIYCCGRDIGHRPVIVVNVEMMIKSGIDYDKLLILTNFWLDHAIKHMMLPGKVENWVIIADLNNVGVSQIPKELLKGVAKTLSSCYRARLFKLWTVNCPWMLRALWAVVKKRLDEFQLAKFSILSTQFEDELNQLVPKDNREAKYGGTLPNFKDNFFPPQCL